MATTFQTGKLYGLFTLFEDDGHSPVTSSPVWEEY